MSIGCRYDQAANLRALGLDAGSSSNCDFGDGQRISNGKRVKGYLCIWTTEGGQEPPDKEESMGKYTVTPSIGVNIRSGPGTNYGKVGAYSMGTVVDVLEARDGWGRTDKGWMSLAYLKAVEGPQRATDNGIAIQEHIISDGRKNRPGRDTNPDTYITIHETGNAAKGADAAAHGAYLDSAAGEDALVSWHYTVDDHAIVQHLPDYETAYHAGDGKDGPGNTTSIGIEICVNAGGDFEAAKANAAALVRLLMEEHGIPAGQCSPAQPLERQGLSQDHPGHRPGPGRRSWRSAGERRRMCPSWTPTWTRWLMSALSTSPTTGKPGTTPRILWRP